MSSVRMFGVSVLRCCSKVHLGFHLGTSFTSLAVWARKIYQSRVANVIFWSRSYPEGGPSRLGHPDATKIFFVLNSPF